MRRHPFLVAAATIVSLLAAMTAEAQLCPLEPLLANHTGGSFASCQCFIPNEQAGAVFSLPASDFPIDLLELRVGWGSQFGGAPASLELGIHVYPGGLPNPGAPIFTLPGPTLVDGILNKFPLATPLSVASGPFTVAVEFQNTSFMNPFQSTIVHDNNGCQAGLNAILVSGAWSDACMAGVPGDWVFEVVYRRQNCARCPVKTVINSTGVLATPIPNFVAGDEAGIEFPVPAADLPAEIAEIRVGWASVFGGSPATLEQGIHVYQGGLPNPGMPIFTLPGPTLADGILNPFDIETPPGSVVVSTSPVTVTVEFLNTGGMSPFQPTVVHDGTGCVMGKNVVFVPPGGWVDACLVGVTGDWVFEVDYKPISCVGSGRVPDDRWVLGPPLRIQPATGGDIQLDWTASCDSGDTDYQIYEGTIGSYYSHSCLEDTTGGMTTAVVTPSTTGDHYYLVVPNDGTVEGSYGVDNRNGKSNQRPPASSTCLYTQQIGSCP